MANKSYYTFMKIKAPDPTKEGLASFSRKVNEQLETVTMKVYGNIEETDLHSNVQKTLRSKVGREEFSTAINQTAHEISLLATKQEVTDSLDDFAGQLSALADNVDGKTTTYFQDTEPLSAVVNDIWYEGDAAKIWKKTAPGTGMDKWVDITTDALKAALNAAGTAQATADGKIESYYQPSMPTGTSYSVGDLWFDTDDKNKLYRWSGTDWISAQDTHLDATVTTVTTKLIQSANDIRIAAGQTTTDNVGEAIETLGSEILVTPERISAEVTRNTDHVSETPPSGAGLYLNRFWTIPSTGERLRWKAIVEDSSRSYSATKTGAAVSFHDLSEARSLGVLVKTVAKQPTGTPTPTSPLALTGYNKITLRQPKNRNLMPPLTDVKSISGVTFTPNATTGSILVAGTSTDAINFPLVGSWNSGVPLYWLKAGTYTLKQSSPDIDIRLVSNTTTLARITYPTFTLAVDTPITAVFASIDSGKTLNTTINFQIEEGTASTAYIKYDAIITELTPDATLYGLTGAEDEIGNDGHETHRTKMLAITGSEAWWINTAPALTTLARFTLSLTGMALISPAGMCTHFPYNPIPFDAPEEYVTGHMNGDSISIYILKSRMTGWSDALTSAEKIAKFKEWLTGKGVQVLYQLATPTTASVAPVQINGIEGTNVITSDGASITVSYSGSGWQLTSNKANGLYASANMKFDADGLEITQTSLDGKPVATKFFVNTEKFGLFDVSDNTMIAGAGVGDNGEGYFAANQLRDPRVSSNFMTGLFTEVGTYQNYGMKFMYGDKLLGKISVSADTSGAAQGMKITASQPSTGGSIDIYNGGMAITCSGGGNAPQIMFAPESNVIWESGHVRPIGTNTFNLGSSDDRWKYIYSNNSLQTPSDERIKRDYTPLDKASDFILSLKPFAYRYVFDEDDAPKRMGFGAWDTDKALEDAGMVGYALVNRENPDELGMAYTELIAPLVATVQAQQHRIDALESEVSELKSYNAALEARLSALEAKIV